MVTLTRAIAFLSCYICFEWFHAREPRKASDLSVEILGKKFQVELRKNEISWIMRKPCVSPNTGVDPGKHATTASFIFRSEDFRSTLDIGWIPDSGVDFFLLFILDLHRKWRALLDNADLHLISSVSNPRPSARDGVHELVRALSDCT